MIHVAYSLNDKTGHYAKFTGTSILSLFENHSYPSNSITVHLLHDNTLTQENREKFIYLAGRYNQQIKFYNIDSLYPDFAKMVLPSMQNRIASPRFTIGTLYRLLLDTLLPPQIEKIIYLDSDIIVHQDIKELWEIELGDYPIAVATLYDVAVGYHRDPILDTLNVKACQQGIIKVIDYFNDGVMLINLKKFREEDSILSWGNNHVPAENLQFADGSQQYFNICFTSNFLRLPVKFNRFVYYMRERNVTKIDSGIYHFIGGNARGVGTDINDVFTQLYFQYFVKTPWFNENTIGNIFKGVMELYSERQDLMTQISAIISGKRRAFVTTPQNVDTLKNIFYLQEGEEILQIDSYDSLEKLVCTMKDSIGKKIFFMLIGGLYSKLRKILTRLGFIEFRDFINGEMFLSGRHGVSLNFFAIVEKM